METSFIQALNICIAASFLVIAIILYRFIARKTPKWVNVLLWGLVGLRLLIPFSIESGFSLIPSENTVPVTIAYDRYPALDTGLGVVDEAVNPILKGSMEARPEYSGENPMQTLLCVLCCIWLFGAACMLGFAICSYLRLRRKTKVRVQIENGVYVCDEVKSPFILGIVKPAVYLPSDISPENYPHVLSHERAHIKRRDHLWKPVGFLLLSFYWFNPLMWAAYLLLCRDIESACDEKAISALTDRDKADYSEALLALGARSNGLTVCPLAFGELSVKSRVSAIFKYKKPSKILTALSVIVCLVFSVCFLTYKKSEVIAVSRGAWAAERVIGSADSEMPRRFIFTGGGDVLARFNDTDGEDCVRLGKMNTAYISENEYQTLFAENCEFDTEHLRQTAKKTWIISPSVSAEIPYERIYVFLGGDALRMGFWTDGKIPLLYELAYDCDANSLQYSTRYGTHSIQDYSLTLYTQGMGRIKFGGDMNFETMGTYKYENSRLIFKTADSLGFKLVFLDTGDRLIYLERYSDCKDAGELIPNGAVFYFD